jgi:hypothetical protein
MAQLESELVLKRCPHCKVDTPSLSIAHRLATSDLTMEIIGIGAFMFVEDAVVL